MAPRRTVGVPFGATVPFTNHSPLAHLLSRRLHELELTATPYRLTAQPGVGYTVEVAPKWPTSPSASPPDRIRVGQDEWGFWSCAAAVSGSPEYVRADLVPVSPADHASALAAERARAEKAERERDEWRSAALEAREGCNIRSSTITSLRSKFEASPEGTSAPQDIRSFPPPLTFPGSTQVPAGQSLSLGHMAALLQAAGVHVDARGPLS